MARLSRRRAGWFGSYEVAAKIGSAVVCSLLVSHSLSGPLGARQAAQEPQDVEAKRLAAEQGDADAQHSLGLAYQNGDGVPQNDVEARPAGFAPPPTRGTPSPSTTSGSCTPTGWASSKTPRRLFGGSAWLPTRGTPSPSTTSRSGMPMAWAFLRIRRRRLSGITSLPTAGTVPQRTTSPQLRRQ